MFVIRVSPVTGSPGLSDSFLAWATWAMEAGRGLLPDHVAGVMEKPEVIKWDCNGFIGACTGTTGYGFDYEIDG